MTLFTRSKNTGPGRYHTEGPIPARKSQVLESPKMRPSGENSSLFLLPKQKPEEETKFSFEMAYLVFFCKFHPLTNSQRQFLVGMDVERLGEEKQHSACLKKV